MTEFSISIRPYQKNDEYEVVKLWKVCKLTVAWNNPHKDISRKMKEHPELFLVGIIESSIYASIMGGYDGHRGWINYLAVHPRYQNLGFGKLMIENVESKLKKMGCPKINLHIRNSNKKMITFYEKHGYIEEQAISMGKRLEKDSDQK